MDRQIEFDFVRQESARVISGLDEDNLRKPATCRSVVVGLMARIVVIVWEAKKVDPDA